MSPPKSAKPRSAGADAAGPKRGQLRRLIVRHIAGAQAGGIARAALAERLASEYAGEPRAAMKGRVAKILGHMVSTGALHERLTLAGDHREVALPGRAYVTLRVDVEGLRSDAIALRARQGELAGRPSPERAAGAAEGAREASAPPQEAPDGGELIGDQQHLIRDIVAQTVARGYGRGDAGAGLPPPVVLLEANIVHSADFDVLLSLMYRTAEDLMRYVRDVIQMTKHVRSTQTIFVSRADD